MTTDQIEQLAEALDLKLYPWQIAVLEDLPFVVPVSNITRLADRVVTNVRYN